jgi:hypothetical protein
MEWVVNVTPRPLYPRERPGNYCIWDWVVPSAGLDRWEKSYLAPGFDPRTVQPVASRSLYRLSYPVLLYQLFSIDMIRASMQKVEMRAQRTNPGALLSVISLYPNLQSSGWWQGSCNHKEGCPSALT